MNWTLNCIKLETLSLPLFILILDLYPSFSFSFLLFDKYDPENRLLLYPSFYLRMWTFLFIFTFYVKLCKNEKIKIIQNISINWSMRFSCYTCFFNDFFLLLNWCNTMHVLTGIILQSNLIPSVGSIEKQKSNYFSCV